MRCQLELHDHAATCAEVRVEPLGSRQTVNQICESATAVDEASRAAVKMNCQTSLLGGGGGLRGGTAPGGNPGGDEGGGLGGGSSGAGGGEIV
eukprot:4869956-Prymnesium_polylepis.2